MRVVRRATRLPVRLLAYILSNVYLSAVMYVYFIKKDHAKRAANVPTNEFTSIARLIKI